MQEESFSVPQGREESERKQDQVCSHFNPLKVCREIGDVAFFSRRYSDVGTNSIGNHKVLDTRRRLESQTHRATRAT